MSQGMDELQQTQQAFMLNASSPVSTASTPSFSNKSITSNPLGRSSRSSSQVSNFSTASKLTNPVFDLALGDAAASLSDERKANADPLAEEKTRERTALLRASLEQFEEASPERVRKIDLLLLTQGKSLIGYTHQKWTDQQNQRTLQMLQVDAEGTASLDAACEVYAGQLPLDDYSFNLVASEFGEIGENRQRVWQLERTRKLFSLFKRLKSIDSQDNNRVFYETIQAVIAVGLRCGILTEEHSAMLTDHFRAFFENSDCESINEQEFVDVGISALPRDKAGFNILRGQFENAAKELLGSTENERPRIINPDGRQNRSRTSSGPCRGCASACSAREKCVIS